MKIFLFVLCFVFLIPISFSNEYVKGYYRKDGTYVKSHSRKSRNKSISYYNNDNRTFNREMKIRKYREQNGICNHCNRYFSYEEMEGDHIIPYSKGGKTTWNNLQMLCRKCNRSKGNRFCR